VIALRLGQLRSRSHRRSSREGSAAKSAPARSARPATVFRYVFVAATAERPITVEPASVGPLS